MLDLLGCHQPVARSDPAPTRSYLFAIIDHELNNSLGSFIFRTHVLTCSHDCDGVGESGWLVWIGKCSVGDGILPLLFPLFPKLLSRRKVSGH